MWCQIERECEARHMWDKQITTSLSIIRMERWSILEEHLFWKYVSHCLEQIVDIAGLVYNMT